MAIFARIHELTLNEEPKVNIYFPHFSFVFAIKRKDMHTSDAVGLLNKNRDSGQIYDITQIPRKIHSGKTLI